MVDLVEKIDEDEISILDPKAGTGVLVASIINKILLSNSIPKKIILDCYEIDSNLIPYLTKVVATCKPEVNKKGIGFEFNISKSDFIIENFKVLSTNETLFPENGLKFYDIIISNSPYYKINKSKYLAISKNLIDDHPNIYTLFMAVSSKLLNNNGQLIFITPRSFCSEVYCRLFRAIRKSF